MPKYKLTEVPLKTALWKVKFGLWMTQKLIRDPMVRQVRKIQQRNESVEAFFVKTRSMANKGLTQTAAVAHKALPASVRDKIVTVEDVLMSKAVAGSIQNPRFSEPLISTVTSIGAPESRSKAILYTHGGGFYFGNPYSHQGIASHVCAAANGLPVFSVDYPLSPEHKFPTALDAGLAAYENLLARGYKSIGLLGDSAGGNLALSICIETIKRGIQRPAAIAAISPWTDMLLTGGTLKTKDDPFLPAELIKPCAELYADTEEELKKGSPLYASDEVLRQFPPILFHVGEHEVLLDDTLRMAERVANVSSNSVEVVYWKELYHTFHLSAGNVVVEAEDALKGLGQFLDSNL
jgi:monoterpene epsilon-lactone hydrolase